MSMSSARTIKRPLFDSKDFTAHTNVTKAAAINQNGRRMNGATAKPEALSEETHLG